MKDTLHSLLVASAYLTPATSLVLLLSPAYVGAQTCPATDYSFSTQAEVDVFPSDCTEIAGDLRIGPSMWPDEDTLITDLSPLSALTSVGGTLHIKGNLMLSTLDGLSGITTVRSLFIEGNSVLADLDGLSTLRSAADGLLIHKNPALTSLAGLSGITGSVKDLEVLDNEALNDIDGLQGITSLGYRRPAGPAAGGLLIVLNPLLSNLDGLSGVTRIDGDVSIMNNVSLTTLDGLSRVDAVGGVLWISGTSIENLSGLAGITTVGESFGIVDNHALTNLDGLSGIESVGWTLQVLDNAMLTECSCGLFLLVSSGGIGGPLEMRGNAVTGDCNDDGADLAEGGCSAVGIESQEPVARTQFTLRGNYPNPFNPSTSIRFDLPEASEVRLVVFDLLGREVATVLDKAMGAGQHAVTWEAGGLPSGVYLCRLEAGEFVETRQLVLLK